MKYKIKQNKNKANVKTTVKKTTTFHMIHMRSFFPLPFTVIIKHHL